jgi:hypothetical protein
LNRGYNDRNLVYAPKFPKAQQESWFIVAIDSETEKLLGLHRLSLNGRGGGDGTVDLKIIEEVNGDILLRVLSDGWRGVDVEKTIAWKRGDTTVDI